MNCIQPTAPALDGPVFAPQLLSTSLIAARTCHGTLYSVAAAWKIGSRKYGPGKSSAAAPGNGGGASGVSAFQSTETGGKYTWAGALGRRCAARRLTSPRRAGWWRTRCLAGSDSAPDESCAACDTPTGASAAGALGAAGSGVATTTSTAGG